MDPGRRRARRNDRLRELAGRQLGLAARAQALGLGVSSSSLGRRRASGELEPLHPGVYRVAGAPASWEQEVLAACLWAGPGALASHRTAGRLWGLASIRVDGIEVTTSRRLTRPGVVVHRGAVGPRDGTRLGPVPVTTVARTLLDLAAVVDPGTLEIAVESARSRGLTTTRRLARLLGAEPRHGRPGAAALRRLVGGLDPSDRPTESVLETRLVQALRRHRLPPPRRQHAIREGGRIIARVDLAYPEHRLAIEADGYRYHGGPAAWRSDLARRNALTSRGWLVLHVTWRDVTRNPYEIARQVRAALSRARPLPSTPSLEDPSRKTGTDLQGTS